MGYLRASQSFVDYGEACRFARSEALASGTTFIVVPCEGGWAVTGRRKSHTNHHPFAGQVAPPRDDFRWFDEPPESEDDKQARIREINARVETALYEKLMRETYGRPKSGGGCAACDRPIAFCRCG